MAVFSVEIPDEDVERIFDAFCASGWTADNGVSRSDFTRAAVIQFIKDTTATHELREAQAAMLASLRPPPDIV